MAIDKKRVEEFEEKYKEVLFSKISEAGSIQFDSINLITTNARNIGQSNVNIPNSSITLNNKLVELSQEFKQAGISMFSSELEEANAVSSSFLGDTIIKDLIEQLSKSSKKLGEYNKTIRSVSRKKNEQMQALQNVGPIRKFFSRIKSFFVPVKPAEFSLTEEEQNTLNTSLQEYMDIDNKILHYNLEDNLVPTLVKTIAEPKTIGQFHIPHCYEAYAVPDLLEERVIPDLKKLGLEHLIPQLQEDLIKEYKKDLPAPEIYKVRQENMYLYVPDFNKESRKSKEIAETDLEELHSNDKEILDGSKKDISLDNERD